MEKRTHQAMPLSQRLFCEALQELGPATLPEIAIEMGRPRDAADRISRPLVSLGYVATEQSGAPRGGGRPTAIFSLTGKPFPPSAELDPTSGQVNKAFVRKDHTPMCASTAVLVQCVTSMVRLGAQTR
ncbi:hypothetical protein PQR34_47970 [Paraburkholderia sediminicola]|uniref:hypothetical protein n=1 Tax=Paraburkholderia sediminicola TaxID=458836 RepID=UPI0038BA4019